MSAIICPKCHRHVTRPETDDLSVWVHCPLCHAEYSLQSAVEFVPPMLTVVSVPAPAAVGAEGAAMHKATAHAEHAADIALDDVFSSSIGQNGLEAHPPTGEHGIAEHDLAEHDIAEHTPDFGEHAAHGIDDPESMFDLEASEHAQDAAEHQDGDDEFKFADEHGEHAGAFGAHGGDDDAGHDAGAAMGSLATMVAAAPVKKKRKVPLKVKLIGATMFLVIFLVVDVLAYSGLLFFGSDPFHLKDYFPKFVVAKTLREEGTTPKPLPKKPGGGLASDRPTGPGSKPNSDAVAPPPAVGPSPTDAPKGGDATKTPDANPGKVVDNPPMPPVAPNPTDVATKTPDKTAPAAGAFDDPTKQSGTDPTQPDLSKIGGDIPEPKGTKPVIGVPPGGDIPNPADKGGDKPTDKPALPDPFDKPVKPIEKPADKPIDKPLENPLEKPLDKPADKPADKPVEKPADKPADAAAAVGPKSDAAFSLDDAGSAIDAAKKATAAYAQAAGNPADAADLKKARIAEVKALSHVATVLSSAKGDGPDGATKLDALKTEAAALLSTGAASGPEREELGTLSGKWMSSPSRKENGAFVEGTLKKTVAVGKLYQSEVQLFGKEPTVVTILTAEKPTAAEGTSVSVLGVIMADPKKDVAGYEGDAATAVWGAVVTQTASK